MIPRIKKLNLPIMDCKYEVEGYIDGGNYGSDITYSLGHALRFWLYHCNISPKICFFTFKKR